MLLDGHSGEAQSPRPPGPYVPRGPQLKASITGQQHPGAGHLPVQLPNAHIEAKDPTQLARQLHVKARRKNMVRT